MANKSWLNISFKIFGIRISFGKSKGNKNVSNSVNKRKQHDQSN